MFWRCPYCHGTLAAGPERIGCEGCGRSYPVVAGLPDLRVDAPAWLDFGKDRDRAIHLDELIRREGLEAAILDVFRHSRRFHEAKARFRMKQVLAGIAKCEEQIAGWLAPLWTEPVFELGVGPGQFVAAAARRGLAVHGIDVSLEWLVVAKHWARSLGAESVLAAGMAERLPLANGQVGLLVSLDVIEHVGDQARYAAEVGRVLRPGGAFALVTPNRFSLSPEPHVNVWGVGYLPVRLQAGWVRLVSGRDYAYNRLLSTGEIRRLFEREAGIVPEITFPAIADEEIALFGRTKARLARIYNSASRSRLAAPVMPLVGTHYRAIGRKPRSQAGSP